ncbi:hypothetical protein D187_000648 [Cystobacter fuscus DSM 2262]|uniref:Uncharacterized protein n=1 Tax=Cystobacter fuscus (strain ATCC 25194 / DSM 2262 / NBRC 100088 / M29) TaxID=1242864 RepID=S9R820_CYSF2|nr:hypothetical protein D187_000648 [Cystobacter fuscus DSM 2262]
MPGLTSGHQLDVWKPSANACHTHVSVVLESGLRASARAP